MALRVVHPARKLSHLACRRQVTCVFSSDDAHKHAIFRFVILLLLATLVFEGRHRPVGGVFKLWRVRMQRSDEASGGA